MMSPEQAQAILNDENIKQAAIVLNALDTLQAIGFNLMEPELRKLGKFSESSIVQAADEALEGWTYMAIPGNGNGVKMTLSIFLRSLQLLNRENQVAVAMEACRSHQSLTA